MTGRGKVEAALSEHGTPEIPAVINYHGIFLRDHWEQVTDQPWWALSDPDPERQFAVYRDLITALDEDWFVLPTGSTRKARKRWIIEERPDGVYQVDRRTGQTIRLERPRIGGWPGPGGSVHIEPKEPITSREQIEQYVPLSEELDNRAPFADGRADLTVKLLETFGDQVFPFTHVSSALWGCYHIWGFEGMMMAMLETPDLFAYACDRFTEQACRRVRTVASLGSAGIWIEECMTDMVSPDHFARFNFPYLRRLVEEIRAQGMHSIYYYCGDPEGKWDLLLSSGADALSLEESKKGFAIDIEDVARRVGRRIALLGNLDAIHLLKWGSEEELRTEIARQIAAGRVNGGRFIMSLGSPVTPGTSVARVRRYIDLVHEREGAGQGCSLF